MSPWSRDGDRDRVCCRRWQLLPRRPQGSAGDSCHPCVIRAKPGTQNAVSEAKFGGVWCAALSQRGEEVPKSLSRGSASTPLCLQEHLGPGMPCSGTCPAHPFGSWNTDMRLVFVPCQAKWDPDQSTALPSYFQLLSASQGAASTEDQSDEEQPCLPGSGGRGRVAEPPHPSAEQVPSVSELLP